MAEITSLLSSREMSEKLKGVVTAKRLDELAAAGLIPHYDVDGLVMFGASETKEWLNHNLVSRVPGRHIGDSLVTIVKVRSPHKNHDEIPQELAMISGSLIPICIQSEETVGMSGVYFLCENRKVVYVGQSSNVFGRVGAHIGKKSFDSVWFARVPRSDLDAVESALIHALNPKYNFDKRGVIVAPTGSPGMLCADSVDLVSLVCGHEPEGGLTDGR